MSAGHLSREFRATFGESPYSYLMTRRVERAMALLRRGDLSVTEVCFEVGFSSLGTFSTRFRELVGVPPSAYRAGQTRLAGELLPCRAKQVTRPVRNREAAPVGPPNQPETSVVLHPPAVDPGITDEERRTILELVAKGSYGALTLATDDLDGLFERLQASGAVVVQEPMDQPYGV